MAAEHHYGKAITFNYFPHAGNEAITLDSLVSARLYGPNTPPTEEQLEDAGQASTGHIGARVTSWTLKNDEGTGPAGYRIVFPALADSNPGSSEEIDKFYVALNFRAEAGGPVLRDDEQIFVYRPDGLTSKIECTAQQVFGLESKIAKLRTVPFVEEKIDLAMEELLDRLEGRGYAKRRLFNLYKLSLATRMLACSYCCLDLAGEGNTVWERKSVTWRELANQHFEIAKVGVDQSGGDRPEASERVQIGGAVAVIR